jgi:acetoin:2,6-dichlorophenolindophenol oxidoreductase subunit alpha
MTSPDKDEPPRRAAVQESSIARLERMIEIRLVEDRVASLFGEGTIRGTTHLCQGQEAIAVAVAAATRTSDFVTCTYRGHGYGLALGMSIEAVLGEIMGRRVGALRGLGGSMHLCDPTVGLLPTMAIVGAGLPIAVGAALSARVQQTDSVALAVFGDGAANIGAFHEALNLASVWKLPVIFICENNLYGEYSRFDQTTTITDISDRAAGYRMKSQIVDGQDLDVVLNAVAGVVEDARSGGGPAFLEMKTYRYSGHSRSDPGLYRPAGELESWLQRDPIDLYAKRLIQAGTMSEPTLADILRATGEKISRTVDLLMATPGPSLTDLFSHVSVS